MSQELSGPRKASYLLLTTALIAIVYFHLAPALLTGLFAFMVLDQSERRLRGLGLRPLVSRWAALGILLLLTAGLGLVFEAFIRIGLSRFPDLLERAGPRVGAIGDRFGLDLPFDTVEETRQALTDWVRRNVRSITAASGLFTRGVFQSIIACVAAVLFFFSPKDAEGHVKRDLHTDLTDELSARAALFVASFERVVGAQVVIAAINAAATAAFLFSVEMPFRTFLVLATFVCGLVPIVGNIASNTLIVAAALTRSEQLAAFALIFLVVIHKAEYFLNSRIVGASIKIPMWTTLLGILAGEVLMGVPGVILAPTLLFYLRAELQRASEPNP